MYIPSAAEETGNAVNQERRCEVIFWVRYLDDSIRAGNSLHRLILDSQIGAELSGGLGGLPWAGAVTRDVLVENAGKSAAFKDQRLEASGKKLQLSLPPTHPPPTTSHFQILASSQSNLPITPPSSQLFLFIEVCPNQLLPFISLFFPCVGICCQDGAQQPSSLQSPGDRVLSYERQKLGTTELTSFRFELFLLADGEKKINEEIFTGAYEHHL